MPWCWRWWWWWWWCLETLSRKDNIHTRCRLGTLSELAVPMVGWEALGRRWRDAETSPEVHGHHPLSDFISFEKCDANSHWQGPAKLGWISLHLQV
jgi:hypothetical protein